MTNDIEAAARALAPFLPDAGASASERWILWERGVALAKQLRSALAHATRGEGVCDSLIETAARHAACCVEYDRRERKADARDVAMVERAVASALDEVRHVRRGGVSLSAPTPPPATGEAGGKMGPDVLWQHDETGRTQLCHEGVIPGCGWRRVYLLPASKATGEAGTREAEIRKDERERCAKVCEAMADEIAREDIPYHRREERVGAIVREMQSRRVAQTIRALPEAREGGRS